MTYDDWKTSNPADEELGDVENIRHPLETSVVYGRTYYHYRHYKIWRDPPPVPTRAWDWHYQHDDIDLDDNRYGHCATLEACKGEIDDAIEDEEFEAQMAKELAPYRRPLREEERDI